jgi:hypothetical protein
MLVHHEQRRTYCNIVLSVLTPRLPKDHEDLSGSGHPLVAGPPTHPGAL